MVSTVTMSHTAAYKMDIHCAQVCENYWLPWKYLCSESLAINTSGNYLFLVTIKHIHF